MTKAGCRLFLVTTLAAGCAAGWWIHAGVRDPEVISWEAATLPAPALPGWELVWHDEFDGHVLDAAKWSVRSPGRRESAVISADNVSLDGQGHLRLTTTEVNGVIHTGMVGSQGRFSRAFGRWEARIRFQSMQGHHGAFWLQPESRKAHSGNNPSASGAEIDIIEWFGPGRRDGGAAVNVYWPGAPGQKLKHVGGPVDLGPVLRPGESLADDFRVFAVEWTEDEYVFLIDDHEVFRTREGVSHQPQYVILSLLCADWEAPRLDRNRLPDSMVVDYVRVYRKATAGEMSRVASDAGLAEGCGEFSLQAQPGMVGALARKFRHHGL